MSDTVYVQEGDILDYTPLADAKAGELVFLGTLCGQVVTDVEAGELGGLRVKGVIRLTKETLTDLYSDGDAVLWNDTNKTADPAGADGTVGVAVNGGSSATDAHVYVRLNS
ncbi:MAG TPA: hypothetical protein DDW52_10245 [Planctomycetaceae bacterium]|nr:hypothetical protein [Planctomycetaceae bacterium]